MQREKKWSTKGGFTREDSDDELGYDDHPWQWLYEDESTVDKTNSNDTATPTKLSTPSKKRKASAISSTEKPRTIIIGAKMGSFKVFTGDAVFLKSPEQGKDWAGLICGFSEVDEDGEEEMCAHIQWFCSPEELAVGLTNSSSTTTTTTTTTSTKVSTRKRERKLPDTLPNETYITADFNMNPLTAINGKASVVSKDRFFGMYPGGVMPKKSKGAAAATTYLKTIMCRRGVKQRNLMFTEEFVWDDVYAGAQDLLGLIDWVKEQTKGRRRKVVYDVDEDEDGDVEYRVDGGKIGRSNDEDEDEDMMMGPETPKKKRKTTTTATTPKSTAKSTSFMTPTHKRIMIKKPLEITPLGTRVLTPAQFMDSPYSHARTTLHVSAVPTSLPCRTDEFSTVYNHLHSAITDGSGACIYISGTPGTGKTATVREVVASLLQAVQEDELDDFNFVEINGMKVTEPHQSYSLLWEALKGDRVSPSNALHLLEHEFSHPRPGRIPCVVLMDELDQLVTKSQSVMYNFFNWPALRHSRLIVLAVANTMDLPERTLSNKISSRLGLTRITFPGYTHPQLMQIISSRLEGVPGNVVDPDAIQFASRKVAAVSGDARRALDICRRAVEIAEQQAREQEKKDGDDDEEEEPNAVDTPSRKGRKPQSKSHADVEGQDKREKVLPRVTIATIKQAINEAISSPMAQHLKSLPLASKLFLAALLARSRRTGVSESTLGDVLAETKRIADVSDNQAIHDFLLKAGSVENNGAVVPVKKSHAMPRMLAMGAAAMELVEAGIIAMDVRNKGERAGKVRLRMGDDEVKSALKDDAEVRGMGFNS